MRGCFECGAGRGVEGVFGTMTTEERKNTMVAITIFNIGVVLGAAVGAVVAPGALGIDIEELSLLFHFLAFPVSIIISGVIFRAIYGDG